MCASRHFKPHAARTGTIFATFGIVRHRASDGIVYVIRAWFKYDTALLAVV